eukprot:Nitzschia sp. Nitz4//scaffold158_size52425//42947//45307//NITZ4_006863-RA/size52425-snap-gene-0.0-mRNA-1//1//CDS//3329537525//682//frame0
MNDDELKRQMTNSVRRQSENILALTASAGMGEEETEETWTMDMTPQKKRGKTSKRKSRNSNPNELTEHISTDTTRACSDSSSSDENKKPPAVSLDEKKEYRKASSISESDNEVDVADQSAFADEDDKSASVRNANTSNHARSSSVHRTSVRRSKGGVPVSTGPKSLQPGAVAVGLSTGPTAGAAAEEEQEEFDDACNQDGIEEAPPTTVLGAAVSDASSMTASVISAALSPREDAPPAATLPKRSSRVAPDSASVVPEMPALKYHESVATATAVVRDDLEEEVRRQIMSEVIVAEVVPLEIDNETRRTSNVTSSPDDTKPSSHPRFTLLCVGLCCAVFSGAITGMLIKVLQDDKSPKSKDGGKGGSPNNNNPPNDSVRDEAALLAYLQIQSPLVAESGTPQSQSFAWMRNNSLTTTGEYGLSLYEIYALGVLYYSTGGDESWTHTTNWLDVDSGFCSWYPGDLCEVSNVLEGATDLSVVDPLSDGIRFLRGGDGGGGGGGDSVVSASNVTAEETIKVLDLGENNLQGTIPSEIRLLSNLERLGLDKNPGLVGTLPADIGTLENLEGFFAGETSLSGTFPTTMEDLDQLKVLNMAGCTSMSGTFPRDLWHLKRLWTLDLEGMGLEGTLPGPGRSPRFVNLRGNRLSGNFPDSWWPPQLSTLDLRDNRLTGTIPTSLYRSWNNSLYELRLEGNNFSGTIPGDVCASFNQSVTENPSTSYVFSSDCKEADLVTILDTKLLRNMMNVGGGPVQAL